MFATRRFWMLFSGLMVFQICLVGWVLADRSKGISVFAASLPEFLNLGIYDLLVYLYFGPLSLMKSAGIGSGAGRIIDFVLLLPFMGLYSAVVATLVCFLTLKVLGVNKVKDESILPPGRE